MTNAGTGNASPGCRRAGTAVLWVIASLVISCAAPDKSRSNGAARQFDHLAVGEKREATLSPGDVHSYALPLSSGQYLRVAFDQRGVDVAAEFFTPDGRSAMKLGTLIRSDPEPMGVVASTSGTYRLEVRPQRRRLSTGAYTLTIEELRRSTPQDQDRLAAERAVAEGALFLEEPSQDAPRKAIEKLEEAVRIWQRLGDPRGEGRTRASIGYVYQFYLPASRAKAIPELTGALELVRAAADRLGEAFTLNTLGRVYGATGDAKQSLSCFEQALAVSRTAADREVEAEVLKNIAMAYTARGDHAKALELCQDALVIAEETGNYVQQINALGAIGYIYSQFDDSQNDLAYSQRALAVAQKVGERKAEASITYNIGVAYNRLGEQQKALDYFKRALELKRAMADRLSEGVTLNQLGTVYLHLRDEEKALSYFEEALQLRREVGDRRGECTTLVNIGWVQFRRGDVDKALEFYTAALTLSRQIDFPRGQGTALHGIANIYLYRKDYQKALAYYDQAIQIRKAISDRSGQAFSLMEAAIAYRHLGRIERALEYSQEALGVAKAIVDPRAEAHALLVISEAQRDRGKLDEARSSLDGALAIIESQRGKVIATTALRSGYFASEVSDYYRAYVNLLMRFHQREPGRGHDKNAFEALERARARGLLELLAEAHVDIRQGVDRALVERERSLRDQINVKAERHMQWLAANRAEQQSATAKQIDQLTAELQDVEAEIRRTSPRYADVMQPQPLRLPEIQQLLDDDTLLLAFALDDDQSHLFSITRTGFRSYQLPPKSNIEDRVRYLYGVLAQLPASIRGKAALGRRPTDDWQRAAADVSSVLLGPVASQLGTKRLLIVGDGALQLLPLGALPAPPEGRSAVGGKGFEPLILKHELVSVPSASTLAALRSRRADRRGSKSLAVLADPVFDPDDARVESRRRAAAANVSGDQPPHAVQPLHAALREGVPAQDRRMRRLAFSRQEAEAILAVSGTEDALKAVDFAASRARATSELGEYRWVHFATHAMVDTQRPELSGVVLSLVNEEGQPVDGVLRLPDIYNLKLSADLVVLSGCRTALGKEIRGEGLSGLARGFMYAGAPRIVASLWPVDDEASAELMKEFYLGLLQRGMPPAAALRAAQVAIRERKLWRSPYYWAGFVLQGDWN